MAEIATPTLMPCLWFDDQAEAAANFYVSIFPDSSLGAVHRYVEAGQEVHGQPAGKVMTVQFEIAGMRFLALNGGPQFSFNEAVSFQVHCADQAEIDYYWGRLTDGGAEVQCGWLKDRFGLSWQVVPRVLPELLGGSDPAAARRVTDAFLQMKKFDIAALRRAYEGDAR